MSFEGVSRKKVSGLGTQSVLWSDASVFTFHTESGGNSMMFLASAYGAKLAAEKNVPCFCADLTVNPTLVDWNKDFASRLAVLHGMNIGVWETNGHQNYKNWDSMMAAHPCAGADWLKMEDGLFSLYEDFYEKSGGIFLPG